MSIMTTTATLNYIHLPADGAKPYQWISPPPEGTPPSNIVLDPHRAQITEVHSLANDNRPKFERNGVEFVFGRESRVGDFGDEQTVKEVYYAEVEALVKEITGASRVVVFDHTVRRAAKLECEIEDKDHRKPVSAVHIDQTPKAGEARVRRHLGPEADELLKKRNLIVNVWKPFGVETVEDFPLAVADLEGVEEEDKVATDLISAEYATGETYRVTYSPKHKWYYLAHQKPSEMILLKCYDSLHPTKVVPHTAFVNEDARPGAAPRQSIEVRALVFFHE